MERAIAVEGIGQVALPVNDVARARDFYRDVLGLPFLFEAPGLAFFDGGGVRIMLTALEGDEPLAPPLLYYRVSDLERAHRALERAGVAVVSAPHLVHRDERHELHVGFYHDPEGVPFALMHERPLGGGRTNT